MSAPEPDTAQRDAADEQLILWRIAQLIELGVPREDAEWLSGRADIVHRVSDLIEAGASPSQAVRIVG